MSLGTYDARPIRTLTQEDPLGLAGGLNLYGFANGDPVNFSDPFGLCPPKDDVPCRHVTLGEGAHILHQAVLTGQWTWTETDKDVANHAGDCTDYCEVAQENAGLPALDPRPSTGNFATSSDYRPLKKGEAIQTGDVIVQRAEGGQGHAGIATGTYDKRGRPLGIQNGGSGTKVIPWGRGVRGLPDADPVIYRRQVPDNQ